MQLVKPSTGGLSTTRRQRGLTLIEILVTVLVTSVGLLGVAALHLATLRNNMDANTRSQASMLAGDIADRMRANRAEALLGRYVIAFGSTPTSATTRADTDLTEWKNVLGMLPAGDGSVAFTSTTNVATIQVQWEERVGGTQTFETQTEL